MLVVAVVADGTEVCFADPTEFVPASRTTRVSMLRNTLEEETYQVI